MVLVDMAARVSRSIRIITIDTGRLPAATLSMIGTVRERYGMNVEVIYPDPDEVSIMVSRFGRDLFRSNVAHRRLCCEIRKVRPLERALEGLRAWASGLRRDQSGERSDIRMIEETGGVLKLHPLADWSGWQVQEYIRRHEVPRHPLYAAGYTSIGCEPCTRAIRPGEGQRDGRWWWEQDAAKECGIHFSPDRGAERQVDVLLREVLAAQ
jgi:phosphoadenylyl-sulfate reductase (thioredoxin)